MLESVELVKSAREPRKHLDVVHEIKKEMSQWQEVINFCHTIVRSFIDDMVEMA